MPHLLQSVLPLDHSSLPLDPRQMAVVAVAVVAAIGLGCWAALRQRDDPEEMERQRRVFLAAQGRITDASLVDSGLGDADDRAPTVLRYQYRIAGVSYECAQDVSRLGEQVRDLRMDLPVQVRYDPHNPTNSIVVAESWSGLRQV